MLRHHAQTVVNNSIIAAASIREIDIPKTFDDVKKLE
jgi:hypothetical protein